VADVVVLYVNADGSLEQIQDGDTLLADIIERKSSSGNLVIGANLGANEIQMGGITSEVHVLGDLTVDGEIFPRYEMVEFTLTEDVNNTVQWFTTWRSHGGDTANTKRSGSGAGIANSNTCSPYIVPFNANIYRAVLTLKGAGVQNGSVTYPVTYQTDLFSIGFSGNTNLGDIYFSIPSAATPVGTYSVGNTNLKGAGVNLDIDVSEGDLLGLQFTNGNGASVVGQTRNAFISLLLKER
jgi:hypothetical protein